MAKDFKLIIITPEKDIPEETGTINALFDAGLQILHVRKPIYTLEETKNLITLISPVFHPKIILHNHYELIEEFGLKGAHLSEKTRKKSDLSQVKNIVSASFHLLEDVLTEKINLEYAFLSPVFPSISKRGYEPSSEIKKIKNFFKTNREKIRVPLIALGGITDKNILQLQAIGFTGAACIGYIWENPNPLQQFNKLQNILKA
jgi:thiamine monophosphate synthase